MRWQERRIENDLLKRELLLRLEAEHSDAAGRSRLTDFFRGRARRLLRRHPLFALQYHRAARELGLELPEQSVPKRHARRVAGTLAGVALAAAAATGVVATHDSGSSGKTRAKASATPHAAGPVGDEPLHRLRDAWTGPVAAPADKGTPKSKQKAKVRLVSNLQTVSVHTAPPAVQTVAAAPRQSGAPAPLPAPAGASAPSPLKAP